MRIEEAIGIQVSKRERGLAALAYLFGFISGFILLLLEKKSSFVRFHANQSVVTFLGLFLLLFVIELIPVVGAYIGVVVFLTSVMIWVVLILQAIRGKKQSLITYSWFVNILRVNKLKS